MTIVHLLLEDFDTETAMTRRILACVRASGLDFKPHARSMALGSLAWHVASLPRSGRLILTTSNYDVATAPPAETVSAGSSVSLMAEFDAASEAARGALSGSTDADLEQIWTMTLGDRVLSTSSRAFAFRHIFLSHMIHHRAQLGVYLRLTDVPVPGVYGPSADDRAAR